MKKDIHPKYYAKSKVSCACGNAFTVGSAKEDIKTEICGACHPFYTGSQELIDTAGRVERFKTRKEKAASAPVKKKKEKKIIKAKKGNILTSDANKSIK